MWFQNMKSTNNSSIYFRNALVVPNNRPVHRLRSVSDTALSDSSLEDKMEKFDLIEKTAEEET